MATPFSAEALTAALSAHPDGVGRATASRAVDWLRERGWLARVQTERGDYTYARALPGHHHHAVCVRCGLTVLVEGCSTLDTLTSLLAREGFRVQGHILELFGLCARCHATSEAHGDGLPRHCDPLQHSHGAVVVTVVAVAMVQAAVNCKAP